MRKYFTVSGKTYSVFTNSNHNWIAIDANLHAYTYRKKPQRNTQDDKIMWHISDDEDYDEPKALRRVVIYEEIKRQMAYIGWTKSLRKLRENRNRTGER